MTNNNNIPSLAHLNDLNAQFQQDKRDLLDALGKTTDAHITELAIRANRARVDLADAMTARRIANSR